MKKYVEVANIEAIINNEERLDAFLNITWFVRRGPKQSAPSNFGYVCDASSGGEHDKLYIDGFIVDYGDGTSPELHNYGALPLFEKEWEWALNNPIKDNISWRAFVRNTDTGSVELICEESVSD